MLTVIGAICARGIVGAMTLIGSANHEAFGVYLEKVLMPNLWPGAWVVMDNLRVHKSKRFSEMLSGIGVNIIWLPPYSPELSPIEECWSKVKNYLRKVGKESYEALSDAVGEALERVTLSDIFGWFQHCGYRISLQ
jgi:transposase